MYHSGYGYIGIVNGKAMCFATEDEYVEYIRDVEAN